VYSFPPLAAAIDILGNTVIGLIAFLMPLLGPASAAAGIVLLTIGIRLLLLPLGWRQAKADVQRARLAPRVRDLQRRHKNNPERLRRETMALYASEGAAPLAGCLPMVAQAPVFTAVFGLFITTDIGHTVASVPLSAHLLDVTGTGLLVFAVLFAVQVIVGWLTWRSAPASDTPGAGLVRLVPFTTVGAIAFLPLAAGIYLATSTTWTYAERRTLRKIIERSQTSRG
jgi:YidC/Oxa1 family membrane protein insertase